MLLVFSLITRYILHARFVRRKKVFSFIAITVVGLGKREVITELTEAVAQTCSVKRVFLEISQNSQ